VNRRQFVAGLLVAATMGRAQAQQTGKVYRLAIAHPSHRVQDLTPQSSLRYYRAFFEELHRLGYTEGQNLVVEPFTAEGRTEHYSELVRNVVRTNPDVIFALTERMVFDLTAVTTTIPIVCISGDPIATGLVANLARPGGNVTGVSGDTGLEIWAKRLQLLREAVPGISRLGLIGSRAWSKSAIGAAARDAVQKAGISLVGPSLEPPIQESEYRRVFAAMAENHADALIVAGEAESQTNRAVIVGLAAQMRLPALYIFREQAESGGLMAYGYDISDAFRHVAQQIDQIFKGARPADIPFFQSNRFEFLINLKTAKALGLTIPLSLLASADEVIE
jgi:putative ABC transport system substrate-binding protein